MPTELERRYLIPMCAIGATSSVSELLESGSPVDYVNVQGWTPLLAAVFAGRCEVAAMLIERGASVVQCTVHGSPLRVACRQGHIDCVRLLLAAGCSPDITILVECHRHPACAALIKQYCRDAARLAEPFRAIHERRPLPVKVFN